jgi:hypothetical protein
MIGIVIDKQYIKNAMNNIFVKYIFIEIPAIFFAKYNLGNKPTIDTNTDTIIVVSGGNPNLKKIYDSGIIDNPTVPIVN